MFSTDLFGVAFFGRHSEFCNDSIIIFFVFRDLRVINPVIVRHFFQTNLLRIYTNTSNIESIIISIFIKFLII